MSGRLTIQDATGIITDGEADTGVIEGYCDAAQLIPANSIPGYARGACYFNLVNGQQVLNLGSVSSSSFGIVSGWADATSTIASYQSVAGFAVGAQIIDTVSGAAFTNIGTLTSSNFVSQQLTTLGFYQIPLAGFRAIATNDIPAQAGTPIGGLLCGDSAPVYKRINAATDKGLRIQWAATSVIEITAEQFLTPPDMDVTKTSTLNIICSMGGGTDTPTLTVNAFPGVGGVDFGSATAALNNTVTNRSVAFAANKFGSFGVTGFSSFSVTPGAHGTDALNIFGMFLQYSKKLVTA